MSLFVSEDMGASWKKIVKNVPPILPLSEPSNTLNA